MIFYKIVYHHIIYTCDFFMNLDSFFAVVYTDFHKGCGFHRYIPIFITLVLCYHQRGKKHYLSLKGAVLLESSRSIVNNTSYHVAVAYRPVGRLSYIYSEVNRSRSTLASKSESP